MLADGTYDTFTPEERFELLIRTSRALGSDHPAVEPAIAALVKEVDLHREAQGGDAKRVAQFYEAQNQEVLDLLSEIDSALMAVERHLPPELDPAALLQAH